MSTAVMVQSVALKTGSCRRWRSGTGRRTKSSARAGGSNSWDVGQPWSYVGEGLVAAAVVPRFSLGRLLRGGGA